MAATKGTWTYERLPNSDPLAPSFEVTAGGLPQSPIVAWVNRHVPAKPPVVGCGTDTPEDNANLICAAPSLLEACKSILEAIEQRGEYEEAVEQLLAAIAKAEGSSK